MILKLRGCVEIVQDFIDALSIEDGAIVFPSKPDDVIDDIMQYLAIT